LVDAFAELDVFGHSARSGGFVGGRLLRPLDGEGPVVVVAEWETPESYQAWLDNPVREELRTRLEPLLAGDVVAGDLYEEVMSVGSTELGKEWRRRLCRRRNGGP
jgi:hypothetical protein